MKVCRIAYQHTWPMEKGQLLHSLHQQAELQLELQARLPEERDLKMNTRQHMVGYGRITEGF